MYASPIDAHILEMCGEKIRIWNASRGAILYTNKVAAPRACMLAICLGECIILLV